MALTRYLYRKVDAQRSLLWACIDGDAPRARFWWDELRVSGFGEETETLVSEVGGLPEGPETLPPKDSDAPLRLWQVMRTRCVYPRDPRVLPVAPRVPPCMNPLPASRPSPSETIDRWLY